jgi:hypothetical protein
VHELRKRRSKPSLAIRAYSLRLLE